VSPLDRRRLLSAAGTGLAALLAGCGGLFVPPDAEETPTSTREPSPTPTPTATPTPTTTSTPTPTPEAGGSAVEVVERSLSVDSGVERTFTEAAGTIRIENAGRRPIALLGLRIDVIYRPVEIGRSVAVQYVGRRFGGDGENGNGERLGPGDRATIEFGTRWPRDGRAEGSERDAEFGLELRIRRLEFG
jgi:hypothetical protein